MAATLIPELLAKIVDEVLAPDRDPTEDSPWSGMNAMDAAKWHFQLPRLMLVNRWWRAIIRDSHDAKLLRVVTSAGREKADALDALDRRMKLRQTGKARYVCLEVPFDDKPDLSSEPGQVGAILESIFLRCHDVASLTVINLRIRDQPPHFSSLVHVASLRSLSFVQITVNANGVDTLHLLLCHAVNLEHLRLESVSIPWHASTGISSSPSPTYHLKSLELLEIQYTDFFRWVGGDSRLSIRHLRLDLGQVEHPWFREDFSHILPAARADNSAPLPPPPLLSGLFIDDWADDTLVAALLNELAERKPPLRILSLMWLGDEDRDVGSFAIFGTFRDTLERFVGLESLAILDAGNSVPLLVDSLRLGRFPGLRALKVHRPRRIAGMSQEGKTELQRVCKRRGIALRWHRDPHFE